MKFHLVYCRNHVKVFTKVCKAVRIHIAHADCADFAVFVQVNHRAVRSVIIAKRLMKKIQVNVFQIQFFKRRFKGLFCIFIAVILRPEFCSNKKFLAFYKTFRNCTFYSPSNRFFILISCRRIN